MNEPGLRQRLLSILAADAAGYSRLMASDDRATVAALDAARTVFRTLIEAGDGRVIDMAGDSVLAVFDTAAGAVHAAIAIQQQLEAASLGMAESKRMRFRIGVHLGDVIEKADGSVYGDGVNIAARPQALAEPGGVNVSAALHGLVLAKVAAAFDDLGEQQVKNIAQPVRAFRVRMNGADSGRRFGRFEIQPRERRLLVDGAPGEEFNLAYARLNLAAARLASGDTASRASLPLPAGRRRRSSTCSTTGPTTWRCWQRSINGRAQRRGWPAMRTPATRAARTTARPTRHRLGSAPRRSPAPRSASPSSSGWRPPARPCATTSLPRWPSATSTRRGAVSTGASRCSSARAARAPACSCRSRCPWRRRPARRRACCRARRRWRSIARSGGR